MLFDDYWLIIFLVSDVASSAEFVFNVSCPSRCTCETLRIINCSGAIISDVSFENIPFQVEELDLSRNNFLSIPQPLQVRYTQLVSLNLSSNRIPFVARNTFSRMSKLQTLDLSYNLIKSLSDVEAGLVLTANTRLQTLNLSGNGIADLGDGYDQILYSESLLHLDASRCSITHLQGPVVLQGLPKLQRLDLSRNALTRVDGLASSSLRLLDLSECDLQYLRRDTFDRLPNLKEVRLSGNRHLTDQHLRPASAGVVRLDASHCALRTNYASELADSETVLLKGNLLDELPAGAFRNNSRLETLDLSDNRIRHVHRLAFAGADSLRWLDLSGNRVAAFDVDTFSACPRLRHLYVAANWLAAVPPLNSSSLLVLDVSECRVRDVAEGVLASLPALHTLNVSHNRLDQLGRLASASLQVLDASYCRLADVDEAALARLTRLREIDLRGNRLVRLASTAFAHGQLERVSLADNPWLCDCQDRRFHQLWLYLTGEPSKLEQAGGGPRCQHPENVTGQPWPEACRSQWSVEPRKSKDLVVLIVIVTVLLVSGVMACVVAAKESWRVRHSGRPADDSAESQRLRGGRDSTDAADEDAAVYESTRKLAQLPSYDEALLLAKPTPSSGSGPASTSSGDTAATAASTRRQSVVRLEMSKKRQSGTQTEETIDALLQEMARQQADHIPGSSPTHSFREERREYQNVKPLPVQCTEL